MIAASWGAAAGALITALDLVQAVVSDPRAVQLGGALLVAGAAAVAVAGVAGASALVLRTTTRSAVLTAVWLLCALLALTGAGSLGSTTAFGPTTPTVLVAFALLLTLLARSLSGRVAAACAVVIVLVVVRHVVGVRCELVLDGSGSRETLTAEDRARPNVLLVVLDTLRADHVSVSGGRREVTPAIEALAAGGVVFRRVYAQASWTSAATASIFTSLFPSQHGHGIDLDTRLNDLATTLPELLRDAGYTTAAFSGNTHVTPTFGFEQGFEAFHLCDDAGRGRSSLVLGAWKWADGLVARFATYSWYSRVERAVDGVIGNRRSDELLVQAFTRWLRTAPRDRPFFAYLHMMSPHIPYDPSPQARELVGAPANTKVWATPLRSSLCFGRGEELPPERRDEFHTLYSAVVHDADGFVGDVLGELRRQGRDERTMVVVTADHGEEFSEHGNWGHGQSLYEELTRIPLVIRRPGGREAGRRHDMPVMAIDVMPTILAEVRISPPAHVVGRSLLDRDDGPVHDVVFSQILERYCDAYALVADGWKYLEWRREGARESMLFDLAHDPGELAPTAPGGRKDLVARLAQHRRETTALLFGVKADGPSAQQEDRLRALGYVR